MASSFLTNSLPLTDREDTKTGEYKDKALKSQTNMLMKDTTLMEDGNLAMEILLDTIKDDSYCPAAALGRSLSRNRRTA